MKVTSRRNGNRRLVKLANFLLTLPRSKFNLNVIGLMGESGGFPDRHECGSAACAIGWSPHVFPRDCTYSSESFVNLARECSVVSTNGHERDFVFAEKFFGLNPTESSYLFHPDRYPLKRRGQKSVSNRIKSFVHGRPSQEEMEKEYY